MRHAIVLALGFSAFLAPALPAAQLDSRVQESRAAVQEFAKGLKGELLDAMAAGGPAEAISVCKDRAPQIASGISAEKGWQVGRTSLKPRNPSHSPDAWEQAVLEEFERRKAAGEPLNEMEHSQVVETGGGRIFRYMKAIPTQRVCLICHGKDIESTVVDRLDQLYPQDRARGFSEGDLRGAFTLTQPM